jgi:DNA-binding GntR family transcriptional regulator
MGKDADNRLAPVPNSTVPRVPSAPVSEMVKDLLRRAITTGAIPGGTRLVPARVAEELGVGVAAVRSALRKLEVEGLIHVDARRRAVVRELSRTELVELYEIRKLLEPVATARAAKSAPAESILTAVGLLAAMQAEGDGPQWADYNMRFHSVIEEAGSSPRLAVILKNLREVSTVYVTHSILSEPDRVRCANGEHEEILRAIIARDPEAAADAVLRHLDGTLRSLLDVRQVGDSRRSRPAG